MRGSLKNSFTLREAARHAGFRTIYMVDYLARTGIVKPSVVDVPGRGRRRRYSFTDIVLLRAVRHLLDRGLSIKRLKIALHQIKRFHRAMTPEQALLKKRLLVTNGERAYMFDDASGLIELTSDSQFAFAFVLDVENIRADSGKTIDRAKQKTTARTKSKARS